jgi:hypothetical protein
MKKFTLINDEGESFLDEILKNKKDNSTLTKEMFKQVGFTTGESNPSLKRYLLGK